MQKTNISVEQCRRAMFSLVGKDVTVKHNRGRNKFHVFNGKITEAYPAVFVIKTDDDIQGRKTFSYQDILCGDIKIKPLS